MHKYTQSSTRAYEMFSYKLLNYNITLKLAEMLPTYDLVMGKISHWNEITREDVVSSPENLLSSQTRCLDSFDRQKFLYSTEIPGLDSMVCNLQEFRTVILSAFS